MSELVLLHIGDARIAGERLRRLGVAGEGEATDGMLINMADLQTVLRLQLPGGRSGVGNVGFEHGDVLAWNRLAESGQSDSQGKCEGSQGPPECSDGFHFVHRFTGCSGYGHKDVIAGRAEIFHGK